MPTTLVIDDLTSCALDDEIQSLLCDLPTWMSVQALGRCFEGKRPLHRAMLKLAVVLLAGDESPEN